MNRHRWIHTKFKTCAKYVHVAYGVITRNVIVTAKWNFQISKFEHIVIIILELSCTNIYEVVRSFNRTLVRVSLVPVMC